MRKEEEHIYKCPTTLSKLTLEIIKAEGEEIIDGTLKNTEGDIFKIENGIPDFTWPRKLSEIDEKMRATYDKLADEYDKFADHPFRTYNEETEHDLRLKMIELMELKEGDKVLEVGCGNGRGSEYIAKKIGSTGSLYMQELSKNFLNKAIQRVRDTEAKKEYSVANASYLSFDENYFDVAHHFGGINTFSEVEKCLKELARVVKPGGMVVVGDESMGPWLRRTEFGKIMMNSNPLLEYTIPFEKIPIEARQVKVEWVLNGAFFLLTFKVGEGEPKANYDIPIPSERGGSHWTRFYGNLEGVTDTTKKLAYEAREKSGKSMHDWLDEVVSKEAKKQLDK